MKTLPGVLVTATLLMVCTAAQAFRSTHIESYVDPDYKDYRPKKMMLVVDNASSDGRRDIEERVVEALAKKGVQVLPQRRLMPPTRNYSPEDRTALFQREGVDSVLVVTAGAAASAVIPVATNSFSTVQATANASGNGVSVNGTQSTTSYNVYHASSKAEYSAVLFDVTKNHTAWYADISSKAAGTFFVGESGDAKAAAKGVVEGLENDKLVAK